MKLIMEKWNRFLTESEEAERAFADIETDTSSLVHNSASKFKINVNFVGKRIDLDKDKRFGNKEDVEMSLQNEINNNWSDLSGLGSRASESAGGRGFNAKEFASNEPPKVDDGEFIVFDSGKGEKLTWGYHNLITKDNKLYGYWFKFTLDFDKETPIVRGKHDTPFEWELKYHLVKNQQIPSRGIERCCGMGGFSYSGGAFEVNRVGQY